jgi:hypothetical protein
MKRKIAFIFFLAVLFGIASLSCKTSPDKSPAVAHVNLIGTEWERVNPPIDRYTLVFVDKSNCMYVYPSITHKRAYAVEGNKITIENDAYEIEGDTLYYKGEIYFVKVNKE